MGARGEVEAVMIEGVLHVAGRMVRGEVEPSKIVVVGVDIGSELDGKSHPDEDVDDPIQQLS